MSWVAVARKDFRDAVRSKVLWLLSALFVVFAAGVAYVYTLILGGASGQAGQELTSLGLIVFMLAPVGTLVPITALVVGYKAVAGEVESGTLKLLLSLPHTREDVVFGKLVGRTAVLAVPVVVGFVVAAVEVLVLYASFDPTEYLLFLALTVMFGAAFVSVAVGVSAATKSTTKAAASVFGVFVLFEFLWDVIPMGVYYVLEGSFFLQGRPPNWYLFLNQLSPGNAYGAAVRAFLPNTQRQLAATLGGDVPFYLTDWFALVILAVWVVAPVTLGYLAFERKDL